MPYKSEVATSNGTNEYLYENLHSAEWNGSGTQPTEHIDHINGYWTLSSSTSSSGFPWIVGYADYVTGNLVDIDDSFGVRPVITLEI